MKSASINLCVSIAVVLAACDKPKDQTISKSDSDSKELTVDTADGKVVAQTMEIQDFPQKVVAVNADELRQFAEWAVEAEVFLKAYGTSESENALKSYDEAFKAWQESTTKKHSDQDVIKIIGAYLGQRMVQDFDMEWVLVSDQFGEDYAVRHKTSELMSFPFSSVMKRIEDKEHDFIHGVYHIMKHQIENGESKRRSNSEQDPNSKEQE